jgi:hypothetical protein
VGREAPSGVLQPCCYVDTPAEGLAGERGRLHRDQYLASNMGVGVGVGVATAWFQVARG